MLKTYKFRIYPNQIQQQKLIQHMGCVRFIYNAALEEKNRIYTETKKSVSCIELCGKWLISKKKEFVWLKEAYSQSLQMPLRNLDNAFTAFFRKQNKFPKFKCKNNYSSIQYPQHCFIDFEKNKIQIPKIGKVNAVFDRTFQGKIKTVTITKVPSGKFFASVLVDNEIKLPKKAKIEEKTSVGIDFGIKTFATLSNGKKVENPRFLSNSLQRLKTIQKRHSRKQKGSKNREKARIKLARIHEKIVNQRKDFLQKTSTEIIRENQTIILEDLNIAGMMKNHCLARAIGEIGWSTFKTYLQYKSEWYGKNLIFIGRFDPSSKMCSKCGTLKKDLSLKDREWKCEKCNSIHDRDLNAAQNIKNFGLIKVSGQELPVVSPE